MAKKNTSIKFSKATISKEEDGRYIITEIGKDDSTEYDFSAVLDKWIGIDGLSISISADDEISPLSE